MYVRNAIQTPDGTILESKSRHDFVTYIDKNGLEYMVDGGLDYLRRNVHKEAPYIELSIEDDNTHETRRNNLKWGVNYTKEMIRLPQTEFRLIKDLEIDHIKAILEGGYSKEGTFYNEVFKDELKYRENL